MSNVERRDLQGEDGFGLLELMISMALGMLLISMSVGLFMFINMGHITVNNRVHVQEHGRYALEILARAIRQSAYDVVDSDVISENTSDAPKYAVFGMDNVRLPATSRGLTGAQDNAHHHGSDVLALRFSYVGYADKTEGALRNCAGFSMKSSEKNEFPEEGWSIFYVDNDSNGEPELRCKYQSGNSQHWNSAAIARGIESFQVLYAVKMRDEMYGISPLMQYLNATQMQQEDWMRVVAIRVALLIRSDHHDDMGTSTHVDQIYRLFGSEYANDSDVGTVIDVGQLPAESRHYFRKIFHMIVPIRNGRNGTTA